MADLPDSDEPVIVDGDVLEAAKENIQPLASGRRVTALSAILSTPHAQRESRLAASRNRHRINVEVALEDEDDDPLEAYCRFVYWVVENYPQGHSAESGLLELLEEATRVLKDDRDGQWRSDIRYLKLWVLYARYVEKPHVIFKFLLVNEIGTGHSLLYEEFAAHLERAGRKTEADEIYRLGAARKATPTERLEAKHRDFQKRMMASIASPTSIPAPIATSATGPKRRSVLGESSTVKTRSSARTASASTATADVFSAPSSSTAPRPNARMQIFVDPDGNAENDPTLAEQTWEQLGTRKSRIKENVPEVSKMAGTTVRQAGRPKRAAAAAPKMMVYRDPEPDVEEEEGTEKKKSKMEVFRDDEPASGHARAKSSIAVFKDEGEPPAAAPTSRAKGKTTIPVFRDEELEAPPKPAAKTKGKSSITILRDEKSEPAPSKAEGKSAIPVFKDEEDIEPPATTSKHTKGKSSIPVFRDEEADLPPSAAPMAKKGSKGKSAIAVFRDEDEKPLQVPATPKFTPFRDEEPHALVVASSTALDTALKPKPVGLRREPTLSSEAEALRKDPFKNYGAERPSNDD